MAVLKKANNDNEVKRRTPKLKAIPKRKSILRLPDLKQLNPGADRLGDCYRTCVAMVLGLPNPVMVPHFMHPDVHKLNTSNLSLGDVLPVINEWLNTHGLGLFMPNYMIVDKASTLVNSLALTTYDQYAIILTVKARTTPSNQMHCVVLDCNGRDSVLYDPNNKTIQGLDLILDAFNRGDYTFDRDDGVDSGKTFVEVFVDLSKSSCFQHRQRKGFKPIDKEDMFAGLCRGGKHKSFSLSSELAYGEVKQKEDLFELDLCEEHGLYSLQFSLMEGIPIIVGTSYSLGLDPNPGYRYVYIQVGGNKFHYTRIPWILSDPLGNTYYGQRELLGVVKTKKEPFIHSIFVNVIKPGFSLLKKYPYLECAGTDYEYKKV